MNAPARVLHSTIIAALGGLLFGFDTAVISGATGALEQVFQLTAGGLGFTVAIALVGTVVGSIVAGNNNGDTNAVFRRSMVRQSPTLARWRRVPAFPVSHCSIKISAQIRTIQAFSEWVFGFLGDYHVKIDENDAIVGFPPMPDPKRYDEFAGLVRLHMRQVLAYINSLVLNWSDADDLFQETCVVLWQKFDEFTPGTNFLAWALRIADHKVMKFQAEQSRRAVLTAKLRDAIQLDFANRSSEDPEANLAALSDCMAKLSQDDQRTVRLCYIEGIPVRQLADAMCRPLKSVQNSLYRIRARLLDCVRREVNKTEVSVAAQHCSIQEKGRI